MKIFNTPSNSYTDYYDFARYSLAWNINIVLAISLFIISIFFSFHNSTSFVLYLSGCIIALTGVIYLVVTKKYIFVSYFMVFCSILLVISSLFFVKNNPHIIDPLWLIIITIFAYFNLGKRVGNLVLIISMVSVSLYFYFFLNSNETLKNELSFYELIGLILEFSLCMIIIGFFIYKFIETTAHTEQKFREANLELNKQYSLIHLQNEEKTVLLKEIHHRVKNNLQVITSLLRLQSAEIDSEETKLHFNDAINRVMTMSLIHQKMYQEKNLSQIDIADYFETLIVDLKLSSIFHYKVDASVISELEKAGTKTIVPLALLVSELVSNSLKHAFEKDGEIIITISAESNGFFTLEYRDTGTWKKQITTSSFGLQLIETLTDQLEGTYTRDCAEAGTYYKFSLQNLDD